MNNMSFIKGIGIGMMVGSVAGMAIAPKKSSNGIGKAIKSIGSAVDTVVTAIGL